MGRTVIFSRAPDLRPTGRESSLRASGAVDNPVCIVEVLSENTASYDQGEKLIGYKSMSAVQAIVFVSQNSRLIVVHYRRDDSFEVARFGAGDRFELPRVSSPVAVDEVYA